MGCCSTDEATGPTPTGSRLSQVAHFPWALPGQPRSLLVCLGLGFFGHENQGSTSSKPKQWDLFLLSLEPKEKSPVGDSVITQSPSPPTAPEKTFSKIHKITHTISSRKDDAFLDVANLPTVLRATPRGSFTNSPRHSWAQQYFFFKGDHPWYQLPGTTQRLDSRSGV